MADKLNQTKALPRLTMSREEARGLIEMRIEAASPIVVGTIHLETQFAAAEEREKTWRSRNHDLLAGMFSTDEVVVEYEASKIGIHQVQDRYDVPSIPTLVSRLTGSVRRQVAKLKAIAEGMDQYEEPPVASAIAPEHEQAVTQRLFLVQDGRNDELARFLERAGFDLTVLPDRIFGDRTLIDQVEYYPEITFAVVLLTPDDEGRKKGGVLADRARQGSIGQLFYFLGKFGRQRVCALRMGALDFPAEVAGVVYVDFDENGAWQRDLLKRLDDAGYQIDWRRALT